MTDNEQEKHPVWCAKCGARSGDDWEQCGGKCPVKDTPHFDQATRDSFMPAQAEVELAAASSRETIKVRSLVPGEFINLYIPLHVSTDVLTKAKI